MSRHAESLYDRQITLFSPEGKLFQVEYAFRAVKGCNLTTLALKGDDCVCICVQKKLPSSQNNQQDALLDSSYVTSLHNITDHIGACMIGMNGDCQAIVQRSRSIAADFGYEKGYPIPIHFLCHKVANLNQVYTQHVYMRLHACVGIFVGIDEEKGPAIYKFDPAGWYAGFKATAAGAKEQEATNSLEKLLKKKERRTEEETVEAALFCLQTVLLFDFKAQDVEVAVCTKKKPEFRRLEEQEIDNYLNAIAERE